MIQSRKDISRPLLRSTNKINYCFLERESIPPIDKDGQIGDDKLEKFERCSNSVMIGDGLEYTKL